MPLKKLNKLIALLKNEARTLTLHCQGGVLNFFQSESVKVHALQVMEVFTELGQAGFKDKPSKWA